MTANPLKSQPSAHGDMPRGHDPDQVAARQKYWLAKGRESLDAKGMNHLQWSCINGHYFIEPRR